jgi:hypothetical protein
MNIYGLVLLFGMTAGFAPHSLCTSSLPQAPVQHNVIADTAPSSDGTHQRDGVRSVYRKNRSQKQSGATQVFKVLGIIFLRVAVLWGVLAGIGLALITILFRPLAR